MLGRAVSFVWNNSPYAVALRLKGSLRGPMKSDRGAGGSDRRYAADLRELFHQFISLVWPSDALPKVAFLDLIKKHQAEGAIRVHNRYAGDLWYLFGPDYRERLDEHYKAHEMHLTMTFLSYAANPALISEYYVKPYRIARERLARLRILELGSGVPHGLIHEVLYNALRVRHVTLVDLDAVYMQFATWFCRERGIDCQTIIARAGKAADLPRDRRYDFIVAKDVLEHLKDPGAMLRSVLGVVSDTGFLALDLEDKGEREYQHISPALGPLREQLAAEDFEPVSKTGNVALYQRASRRREPAAAGV